MATRSTRTLRRFFFYVFVLVPGLTMPLAIALHSLGVRPSAGLAALLTAIVAIYWLLFHGHRSPRPLFAFSVFSFGGSVASYIALRSIAGDPTDLGFLVVAITALLSGVCGILVARTGRLDGFARTARAGPR